MSYDEIKLNNKAVEKLQEVVGGGQGGGSVIVDALPAQGVEGTTYLLRKTEESEVFKGHLYFDLTGEMAYIVSENGADLLFYDEVDAKLNFNQDESGLVKKDLFIGNLYTPEDWQELLEDNECAIVSTEQDVLNLTEEQDYIFQDLGIVHIQDFKLKEIRILNSGGKLARLEVIDKDCLIRKLIVTDADIQISARTVTADFNLEHPYYFEDWEIRWTNPKVGELTDTFIYNEDELMPLHVNDTYLINLTPAVPEVTYSYTEYVFDQGVYTLIGGGQGGSLYNILITTEGHYYGSCEFTMQVDINTLQNGNDLMQYLKDKGFYQSNGWYPIVGTAHKTSGGDEMGRIFGLRASSGEEGDIFWGLSVQMADFYSGEFLIGEPEYIIINYI